MVCSGAIFNYVTMVDSGVINSGHEPNSVQSLLQCPFERRTLAEKLKVKELGSDQLDGLIYCEELFVELCAAPPQKKNHQLPLLHPLVFLIENCPSFSVIYPTSKNHLNE